MANMDPIVSQELEKLDSNVPFRTTSSYLYHTWAKTWYSRPELYFQPESIEEIQKIVTCARRCRRRLVVVGSGHSPSDLTCTSSWMINLDNFNRMLSVDVQSGTVTFQAGLRLRDLCDELESRGLTVPNLGSINDQSVAGAITTGTHGSSLQYGLLSESITSMKLVLSNGQVVQCSGSTNPSLFRAALLSLGALGIIVEITFQAVSDFKIEWRQTLEPLSNILATWDTSLWSSAEFTRVWWVPYGDTAVVWRADKTDKPLASPPKSYYGGKLGFHTYQFLLWVARYIPRINPWVEWFIFGMQYGFKPGKRMTAVQHGREGLLMDCLFSQYVNEWAIPLSKGPEAIRRLRAFLHDPIDHEATSRMPFSSKGLYIHSPVEVRVTSTVAKPNTSTHNVRPFLDPTTKDEPTLYLNAIMYRPYHRDPPGVQRYYQAFEHLMRDLNGRPHWAKNFTDDSAPYIPTMYGDDMNEFLKIRNEADPDGMFIGPWHLRNLRPDLTRNEDAMCEEPAGRRRFGKSSHPGDGFEMIGKVRSQGVSVAPCEKQTQTNANKEIASSDTSSPPMTTASEESFDYMAKGEASMILPK